MNKAKLLQLSIRLATSTRKPWLTSTQVTHFPQFTHFPPICSSIITPNYYNYINLHQNSFFSSTPESFTNIILSNDWSDTIEIELEKMDLKLTHESIVYVLMKLNKNPKKSLDFIKWVCVKKGFELSYVPYTILLKCLACKDYLGEFWDVVYEMENKGFYIDKHVYLHVNKNLTRLDLNSTAKEWTKFHKEFCKYYDRYDVTKYVVDLIMECDWCDEVEGKLKRKVNFRVTDNFMIKVLRELWRKPLRALKFCEWVGSFEGYEHNSVTYNAMIKILAQDGSIDEFWELIERMKKKGFEVDLDSYMKIVRLDRLPTLEAVKLFELMMDGPYKPSLPECISLLKNISHDSNPDIDLMNRVVNKYVDLGNILSKSVYEGMHRVLCKIGRLKEAKNIVEDMKNAGYEPDNVIYSQEVFGLCKQKKFEEACNLLLNQMEEDGCVPDIKTWTVLFKGYCEAKQLEQALSCFYRMVEKNITPDAEMLEVILNGLLFENKFGGAYKFLVEMVKNGRIKPWRSTYKLMIEKLSEVGKIDESLDLLNKMQKQGYAPFPDPIVQYVTKSVSVENAKKVIWALSENGRPPSATYVWVIKSFLEEGRELEAKEFMYSSPSRVRSQKSIRNLFGRKLLD